MGDRMRIWAIPYPGASPARARALGPNGVRITVAGLGKLAPEAMQSIVGELREAVPDVEVALLLQETSPPWSIPLWCTILEGCFRRMRGLFKWCLYANELLAPRYWGPAIQGLEEGHEEWLEVWPWFAWALRNGDPDCSPVMAGHRTALPAPAPAPVPRAIPHPALVRAAPPPTAPRSD
jgi:hypothetical protein